MNLNLRRLLCLGTFSLLFTTVLAGAVNVPALRGRVNDYAQVMTADQTRSLESQLAKLETDTGHQVAVLTLPTLDGEDIEGFSIRVAEAWRIGKKGFDNGVILVVAVNDRRLRLEVGYGLEGVLPDAIAKQIMSDYIVPFFRSGDYGAGIVAGISAVEKVIRQEPLPESARRQTPQQGSELNFLAMLVITFAVLALMAFSSFGKRRRNGVWASHGRRQGPSSWGSPGGFGGGFSSRGGFGGGSFGGGGGSFGGGGASSRW
ncbi:MAG TPA: TPM domain-containing protein [Candidatus Limnocylindria bacterium]|nr:TPM domain-containing protein [Candidatus Limnocylindria bacterium]